MSQLGIGVMINMLSGNEDTVDVIKSSLGKTIKTIDMIAEHDGTLNITFSDDSTLQLWDGGRSCCESRYMTCEDNLSYFAGAKLTNVNISEAASPALDDTDEYHEIQFLDITTSTGLIQIATHNEHNGYYGGFYIQAKIA